MDSLKNLIDAIEILDKAQIEVIKIDFAWKTIKHADDHIQRQVAAYFARLCRLVREQTISQSLPGGNENG